MNEPPLRSTEYLNHEEMSGPHQETLNVVVETFNSGQKPEDDGDG